MQTILQTPTNKLQNSISFYQKLNFEVISKENPTILADGKAIIEINSDRFARAGIKLFKDSWEKEIGELKEIVNVEKKDDFYLLSDPSGMWIYLIEGSCPVTYEFQEKSFGVLGNFQGLSLETTDMKKSVALWKTLGYSEAMGDLEQGWMTLTIENGIGISLMKPFSCPHLFFNPSMTYFNGKENLGIIQKIRDLEIPISEEITHFNKENIVDNIIIRDPGGFGFFLFSD